MITIDTNVLVYIHDSNDPARQAASAEIFRKLVQIDAAIGLQAVGELHNVLRRKLRRPAWEAAQVARNMLVAFQKTFGPTETAVQDALSSASVGRLSYWDALLVASARDAGCSTILSEDMRPGQLLSVEIVKPFDTSGVLTARARELLEL